MNAHALVLAVGLSLPVTPAFVTAQDAGPASPASADAANMQARIDELERENQTLRMQWGQATMELDRLRKELARLKLDADARPDATAATASPDADAAPRAAATAPAGADASSKPEARFEGDDAAQVELERLRRENVDLRAEKAELTQLAGMTADGEIVASQDARITTTYDDTADQTIVRTEPQAVRMLAGSAASHFLSLAYTYPGQGGGNAADSKVTGYVQAQHSGGVHAGDSQIEFILDGETITLPITEYRVNHRQVGMAGKRRVNRNDETVGFALDAESLRRIARGVRGEARIGNVRFELSRSDLAMFKAVQRRIEKGI